MVLLLCSASLLTATSAHSWLWRCLYLLLFLAVALLGAREWKRNSESKTITSPALTANSNASTTGMGWTLRSLIDRRRARRVSDEERRGREVMEGMKRHIPRWRGWAHLWSVLSLFVIAASWTGWAWLAVSDHREIAELKAQIKKQDALPPNTVTTHGLRVITRIGPWVFSAWTMNPVTKEWEKAVYDFCPGPQKLTSEIQAGVTIKLLQYQPDDAHHCMDISTKFAGYTLERNEHGQPILASYAR